MTLQSTKEIMSGHKSIHMIWQGDWSCVPRRRPWQGLMCSSGNTKRTRVNHAIKTEAELTAQWIWLKENSPEGSKIRFSDKSEKEKRNYSAPQYSCLENSMDRGAWQAIVHVVPKSGTRLSHLHFHFFTSVHQDSSEVTGSFREAKEAWGYE